MVVQTDDLSLASRSDYTSLVSVEGARARETERDRRKAFGYTPSGEPSGPRVPCGRRRNISNRSRLKLPAWIDSITASAGACSSRAGSTAVRSARLSVSFSFFSLFFSSFFLSLAYSSLCLSLSLPLPLFHPLFPSARAAQHVSEGRHERIPDGTVVSD